MKQIYTNQNRLLAMNSKNLLENEGIFVELRNEHTSGDVMLGHKVWLELWVDNSDYEKSIQLLKSFEKAGSNIWKCEKCLEENTESFKICWNCQSEPLTT